MTRYVCIKIVTGEEILGVVDTEDSEFINIFEPIVMTYDYNDDGVYGLKLMNFMSYCDDRLFTFKRKDVILEVLPSEKIIGWYTEYLNRSSSEEESDTDSNPSLKDILGQTFH